MEEEDEELEKPHALRLGRGEQADFRHARANSYHKFIKVQKRRSERRRSKVDPECPPAYTKYKGWES